MYYIGIDAGGTKTAFGLFDQDKLLETLKMPTCHFNQVGFEKGAKILRAGVERLVDEYGIDVAQLKIAIGLAGYGKDLKINQKIEESLAEQLHIYDYTLTSDIHIALIGSLDNQDGIVVIAGTGTIAMALNNGNISRCGGWGYQIGDEGSAYWIGQQALGIFTKMADGRLNKTDLYDAIRKELNLDDDYGLISYISGLENKRTSMAALAKTVSELAERNDPHALGILEQAAQEVGMLVKTLAAQFPGKPIISYYGGVFGSEEFKKYFYQNLEEFDIRPSTKTPVHGALMLLQNQGR